MHGHGGYLFPSLLPEGELFVLPFVPPCLVPAEHPISSWVSRGVRAVGVGERRITQRQFLDFMVRAFALHDREFKLYANGFLVHDDASGAVDAEMAKLNRGIVVWSDHEVSMVVHGPEPLPLLRNLKRLLQRDQDLVFRVVEMEDAEVFKYLGNMCWAPVDCTQFFQAGRWFGVEKELRERYQLSHEGDTDFPASGIAREYDGLQMTELTYDEADASRRAEFERVRKWFYSFVGKDREKDFQLDKIVFLKNRRVEARFLEYYNWLLDRMHRTDGSCELGRIENPCK